MQPFRRLGKIFIPQSQFAYAQFGEDLIIGHLFYQLGITNPSYLDIGANEPRFISNTFLFYKRGSRGVLVEPNPHLYNKLKRVRPKDEIINAGIGFEKESEADFYMFPNYANGLGTFSEKDAKHWEMIGMKGIGKIPVEKVIKLKLIPVNTVLEKYFSAARPYFISLDVEGLDLQILQSIDFTRFSPEVFCVETLGYDEHQKGFKLTDIIDFMASVNYSVYADTHVNTIFTRKDIK